MGFSILNGDITKVEADAIVNAANTALRMGGGVCGAIFKAAGEKDLQSECDMLAPIKTGEAVVTKAFALKAKHIIHTAGPVYIDGNSGEEALLNACYTNSLKAAVEEGCTSIAFPLISSGIYGYPKLQAMEVAKGAILEFLKNHNLSVYLVLFDGIE